MALRVRVCRVDDVPPGGMRAFRVAGVAAPILIVDAGGALRAVSGLCPHEDVELAGGELQGNTVVCPGHAYRFDLRTGACEHDPSLCLPRYRVELRDGWVWVELIG